MLSWHALIISGYLLSKPSWIFFPLTMNIFKGDENLLPNVTFPYLTLRLVRFKSESQQGAEICDIIVESAIRIIGVNFNEILIKGKERLSRFYLTVFRSISVSGNCPPTPPLSQHFALSEK